MHYWQCRLVKAGPWVPARTWYGPPFIEGEELDRSPRWQCLLRLETTARQILFGDATPIEIEGTTLLNLESISEGEYRYLIDMAKHAVVHAPHKPEAAPRTKIDKKGRSVF